MSRSPRLGDLMRSRLGRSNGAVRAMPSRLKASLAHRTARACAGLLRRLPLSVQATVKDRFTVTQRMDYDKAPIWLSIESGVERGLRSRSARKEPETVQWIEQSLRAGDVLFDIGANIGAYSLIAVKATQGQATVYAIEPAFATFAQLTRNILLNRCEGRIIPLPVALSDRTGLSDFCYASLASGAASHRLAGQAEGWEGRSRPPALIQPTLSYRLDDLIAQCPLPCPTHLKLDVDGAELAVLRGAEAILQDRRVRSILVEVDVARPQASDIAGFLEARGFRRSSTHPHGQSTLSNDIFVRAR